MTRLVTLLWSPFEANCSSVAPVSQSMKPYKVCMCLLSFNWHTKLVCIWSLFGASVSGMGNYSVKNSAKDQTAFRV